MWGIRNSTVLLLALVNALLFAALLPLWEGFDEAHHYGYVEELWQTRRLPVLGETLLPADVVGSYPLAPVSPVVHSFIPESTTFGEWFALPSGERERRRKELERLRPESRKAALTDYEAHQPPLAYLLLAPVDWALGGLPLTVRVLLLRMCCAVGGVGLLFFGALRLGRALGLAERFQAVALLLICSSEMLYATTAHVANDWLAVGISAFLLAELVGLSQCERDQEKCLAEAQRTQRKSGSIWRTAGWLATGLLTKAYFLVFAVAAVAIVVVLLAKRRMRWAMVLPGALLVVVLAGPWYGRNLALYGNVGGTEEAHEGVGLRQALAAAPHVDWWSTGGYLARGSLWTGNNSFNSFSRGTLNVILALLGLGMAAWMGHRREMQAAEWMLLAVVTIFSVGVAYATCASVAARGAGVAGASPWYTQVLLAPVVALVCLGWSRWQRVGAALAGVSVLLWAWVLMATWILKLFPTYSGRGLDPMRAREVWAWYTHGAAAHARDLSLTALAPAGWLYAGMAVSIGLTLWLAGQTLRELARRP